MIVDVECERCRGEGWLLQRGPFGLCGPFGLFEATCSKCKGNGAYARDIEDEIEDWMRDE